MDVTTVDRARRGRLAVLAVLAALLPASCTDEPATDKRTSATDPAQELELAQRALREAGTGTYVARVSIGGRERSRVEGSYQIDPPGYRVVREVANPLGIEPESYRMDEIILGSEIWSRTDRTGRASCFLHQGPAPVPEGGPGVAVLSGLTASVGVPLGASSPTADRDDLRAEADLLSTVAAYGAQDGARFGVDISTRGTVPITLRLDEERITGWSVDGDDLVDSAERAGLHPELEAALRRTDLDVELADPGAPVDIAPPPADQVVEITDDLAAIDACTTPPIR